MIEIGFWHDNDFYAVTEQLKVLGSGFSTSGVRNYHGERRMFQFGDDDIDLNYFPEEAQIEVVYGSYVHGEYGLEMKEGSILIWEVKDMQDMVDYYLDLVL